METETFSVDAAPRPPGAAGPRPDRGGMRALGLVGTLGVAVAAGPIVGALIGAGIDRFAGSSPTGLTFGVIVGVAGGMWRGWCMLQEAGRNEPRDRSRNEDGDDGPPQGHSRGRT